MIKTIIFDLGGVYFTDGTKGAIQNIATGYGLSEEQVASVLKGELGTKYRIGEVTADEFWNQAKAQWNIEAPSDELAAIWLEEYVYIDDKPELLEPARELGMAAVTFKNPEQLGQELHSLGVEVEKGREVLREVDDEHNLGSLR